MGVGARIGGAPAAGSRPLVLAADVGGTKTALAAVDDRGEVWARWQWVSDGENPGSFVDRLATVAAELAGEPGGPPRAVGIAVPSVLDDSRQRLFWSPNLPGWTDVPLAAMVRERTGLTVAMDLDGHLAAVGEHWRGGLQGIDDFVCVVAGTGIGAGVFVGGRLHRGRLNLSGCLGWMVVGDTADAPDRVGAVGWLESQAGGKALHEFAVALGHGRSPHPEAQLISASAAGDREATAFLVRAGDLIGRAAANAVNLLSLQAVALGGGVMRGAPVLVAEVKKTLDLYVHPYLREGLTVAEIATGADAPLLGAARIALEASQARRPGEERLTRTGAHG